MSFAAGGGWVGFILHFIDSSCSTCAAVYFLRSAVSQQHRWSLLQTRFSQIVRLSMLSSTVNIGKVQIEIFRLRYPSLNLSTGPDILRASGLLFVVGIDAIETLHGFISRCHDLPPRYPEGMAPSSHKYFLAPMLPLLRTALMPQQQWNMLCGVHENHKHHENGNPLFVAASTSVEVLKETVKAMKASDM